MCWDGEKCSLSHSTACLYSIAPFPRCQLRVPLYRNLLFFFWRLREAIRRRLSTNVKEASIDISKTRCMMISCCEIELLTCYHWDSSGIRCQRVRATALSRIWMLVTSSFFVCRAKGMKFFFRFKVLKVGKRDLLRVKPCMYLVSFGLQRPKWSMDIGCLRLCGASSIFTKYLCYLCLTYRMH